MSLNQDAMPWLKANQKFSTPLRAYSNREDFQNLKDIKSQRHQVRVKLALDRKRSVEKEIEWYQQEIRNKDYQLKLVFDDLEAAMGRQQLNKQKLRKMHLMII